MIYLKVIAFFLTLLFLVGCSEDVEEEDIDIDEAIIDEAIIDAVDAEIIQDRNGLFYLPNTETPYTGWVKGYYSDSEQLEIRYHVKNGEREGLWTEWYKNGQKKLEGIYKVGKREGLWASWYENGQKHSECTYKASSLVGCVDVWNEDGTVK